MNRHGRICSWAIALVALTAALLLLNTIAAAADVLAPVSVPVPSPKAVRYYRSGNVLWIISNVWSLLVPAAFFFSGLSARLRDVAQRVLRGTFGTLVVYVVFFVIIQFVADMALDYLADYVRPHEYGLSAQSLGKWFHDEVVSLLLALTAAVLFLWIPYLLLRRSPQRWWLYTWAASIPLVLFMSFIQPVWIAPLFNDFGPLQDAALQTRILDLAHRAGIEGAKVYEVNKSLDTNEANAYVTGIGATKRIVLWDTTLTRLNPDQILSVLGHEMGHFVLNHVWHGVIFAIAGSLVALWLVNRTANWTLQRFASKSGVLQIADIASLPLLLLILQGFGLVLAPVPLAVSRHMEHEADRFGLEITHDNHDCATTFVSFIRDDLAYPTPGLLFQLWRSSHPPLGERIEFCNDYHPWRDGAAERYSGYFKPTAR